ncbi:MAG TPA: hypothetical protein PKD20_02565 [Candidatus Saccharibacteria bacterium]|jgi:hypothetical protein|nr:hypothetical protein [Candidatus Saccharibacteria bacterium]HMT55736.1 hypothetical protein [Candidatus Saccharibacteria bacterium]
MEYGKAFGVGSTGTLVVTGTSLGFGWFILGGFIVTMVLIVGIKTSFRKGKRLGDI